MNPLTIIKYCLLALSASPMAPVRPSERAAPPLDYSVELTTVTRGVDQAGDSADFIWTQARAAYVPQAPSYAIMTMSQKLKSGSDVYYDLYETLSYDSGKTWSPPRVIPSLKIHDYDQSYRRSMSDMTPQWHRATRKVLNIGKSFFYTDDRHPDRSRREVAYAVYDPAARSWGPYQQLQLPALDHDSLRLSAPVAGCVQWVEEPNGEVLLPIFYYKLNEQQASAGRETFEVDNFMNSDDLGHVTTVVRCRFDGEKLTYVEHGSELARKAGRGLYEPSIVSFQSEYFLTLRADKTAYVTRSRDGLHFEEIREWKFDDGTVLGSYNTQQHWVRHSDGLFLVYTRRGADNDDVFRHRAPLLMAQVDTQEMRVIRATERVLVPQDGVALGNFGVTEVNENETWVTTTEYWRGEPHNTDNEVLVARIRWKQPNRLARP